MANASNPSQQSCTSSPPLSPTTTTHAEVTRKATTSQRIAPPPRFDELQTVYRDGAQESIDAFDFEVEVDPVCELDNINVKLLQHYHGHFAQVPRRPWFMDMIEERPRPGPSLWIRRKSDKLRTSTRTSTSGSKVKRNVLFPATTTITPILNPYPALKNIKLSEPSNSTLRHQEEQEFHPRVKRRRHGELPDAVSREEAEIEGYLDTHRSTPFPLLRLPRKLRDNIYAYLTLDEAFWIARPPVVGKQKNAVFERKSMSKPATLIKSKHSLIFVCRDTRDEFRVALWRDYVYSDRQVTLRIYDFDPKPISALFNGCTALELPRLLKKSRFRVNMYFTGDLRRFRKVSQLDPRGLIQTLIMRWVDFCDGIGLNPMYSFSKCTWRDMAMVDIAISQSNFEAGPEDWDEFQTDPHFLRMEPFFRKRFGRLLLGRSIDHQDQLLAQEWRF